VVAGGHPAHIEFQQVLNEELLGTGELVDAQGLAGPDQAKFIRWDGQGSPVITDGPARTDNLRERTYLTLKAAALTRTRDESTTDL
jgi:hypothetical protein